MDTITPLVTNSLLFILGSILLEFIIFLLFASKLKLNIGRIIIAVLTANIISALFGVFIPSGSTLLLHYIWFGVAFLLAIVFEWLIYIAFFMKHSITNQKLAIIAIVANLITYLALALITYNSVIL